MNEKIMSIIMVFILAVSFLAGCAIELPWDEEEVVEPEEEFELEDELPAFESCEALYNAFEESTDYERDFWGGILEVAEEAVSAADFGAAKTAAQALSAPGREYSETNVQVSGVDEADIIKTDGDYIYIISDNRMIIAEAWPAEDAEIISITEYDEFRPAEAFISEDRLMVFGYSYYHYEYPTPLEEDSDIEAEAMTKPSYGYGRSFSAMTVRLYDTSDKDDPELIRKVDFEGSYLSSRMIGDDVYFVLNSYPYYYWDEPVYDDVIVPRFRDSLEEEAEFTASVGCTDVRYFHPHYASNFITVASMSISDEDADINKEIIVGSGQEVYASLDNLYVAQSYYNYGWWYRSDTEEKTFLHKFELNEGDVDYEASGYVPGRILNQFSMDEYDEHFRIATTKGQSWNEDKPSMNNVYVLNEDMEVVGELEDLAPGESIYSVRFMGDRGYVVTFKKVDPLFVIDLADPENPEVLGKLKIPGYSDYLHPYDEDHIIGIGKEAVEAEEGDFAWYQGIKMAIFDVSDVENPIEMHKVEIGDRGTDSEALNDHKAFLFDREKELLIIPVTLALIEDKEEADPNEHGEYVFQGAYVFDINLEDGFDLRGTVTHYDDPDIYKKMGYYFYGDGTIRRTLYIEDVLYTMSDMRLQVSDLDTLETIKALDYDDFEKVEDDDFDDWGVRYD